MAQSPSVVVTGIGLVTPAGLTAPETWERTVRSESGIGFLDRFDVSGHDCISAAAVRQFDLESTLRFPKNVKFMGQNVLCGMKAAREAVSSSGIDLERVDAERVGLYIGSGHTGLESTEFFRALSLAWRKTKDLDYKHLGGRASKLIDPYFSIKTLANAGVGLLSMELGCRGPSGNYVHGDTASALALSAAAQDIREGRCDVAIAGGYDCLLQSTTYLAYAARGLLSAVDPRQAYRPFDAARSGVVLGEGAGFLILERADAALRRGAPIRGELRGWGSAMGARDDAEPKCSEAALRDAIERATGDDIPGFVIAHGIGTVEGDRREASLLGSILPDGVPVTALKGTTGYLGAATAAVELALGFLALEHRQAPPVARDLTPDADAALNLVAGGPRPLDAARASVLCLAWSWGGQLSALYGCARAA